MSEPIKNRKQLLAVGCTTLDEWVAIHEPKDARSRTFKRMIFLPLCPDDLKAQIMASVHKMGEVETIDQDGMFSPFIRALTEFDEAMPREDA